MTASAGLDLKAAPFTVDGQHRLIREAHRLRLGLTAAEFMTISLRAGRIHGPALLWNAVLLKVISEDALTSVIGEVWSMAEYPERCLTRRDWLEFFGRAGFTVNGKPAPRPATPAQLWRGSTHARRRGMSWSTDRSTAEKFAIEGFAGRPGGALYETLAPSSAVLCINSDGREEAEYVLDTRGLKIWAIREAGQQ